MTVQEQINTDFINALKNKDWKRKTFLGVIKGEIQTKETRDGSINEQDILTILKKMEKSLLQINTPESLSELEIIKPYLPQMMSKELISTKVETYINSGLSTQGQIMEEFNKHYKGLVDNKELSEIVKQKLNLN